MLGLLAGSAQDEREARRKGFEQARSRSIKNGVYNGRAPFGYRKRDDGRLETDKPEAKIVLKVFEQREQERHLVDDHERLDRSTRCWTCRTPNTGRRSLTRRAAGGRGTNHR